MKQLHIAGLASFILLLHSTVTSAGILISMQSTTITGSGFVDVMISSTATVGSPDILDSFSTKLVLTPVGGAASGGLQFATPQSDAQLGLGNYVFAGNSLTPAPLGSVTTTTGTNDTYTFGDATVSGTGISLNSSLPPLLLARVDLSVLSASAGSQYTLTVANDTFTEFLDTTFTPLTIDPATFNATTITIGSFSAVPEPSGWMLSLGLCSLLVGLKLRRCMAGKLES